MDIGSSEIVGVLASSTTSYLGVYSPIFLLIGGIILAFVVMETLIGIFFNRKPLAERDDDDRI